MIKCHMFKKNKTKQREREVVCERESDISNQTIQVCEKKQPVNVNGGENSLVFSDCKKTVNDKDYYYFYLIKLMVQYINIKATGTVYLQQAVNVLNTFDSVDEPIIQVLYSITSF